MLETFSSLTKLLRYRRLHIDGYVFRLHCSLTVLILMAFVIINSTKQLVGEPIVCNRDKDIEDKELVNNWCYIKGIHSNQKSNFKQIIDMYFGLGQPIDRNSYKSNVYYQWIWFMLLFQSICFYFPRWLWKGFESERMSSFVSNLDLFALKDDDRKKKVTIIVNYFVQTNGTNDWYAIKYFFCELLALINVIIQMVANDLFLLGQFSSFGLDYINYMIDVTKDNPMDVVFPILSKCRLNRLGISGAREGLDFLCVLSINVFNQKIYLFFWFWLIFLAIVLTLVVLFRLILICCPKMRYICCRFRFELSEKTRNYSRNLIVNELHLGDWFLLYLLGQNIEPIIFCEIIEELCEKLKVDNNLMSENVYSLGNHNSNLNSNM